VNGMAYYLRFVRAGVAQAVAFVVAVLVAPLCAYAENRVLHFVDCWLSEDCERRRRRQVAGSGNDICISAAATASTMSAARAAVHGGGAVRYPCPDSRGGIRVDKHLDRDGRRRGEKENGGGAT
jgi:hypothetical protein